MCTRSHGRERKEYFPLLTRIRRELPGGMILKGEESHQMNEGSEILGSEETDGAS